MKNCQSLKENCLRCAGTHIFHKCPVQNPDNYKCFHCGGVHAACSKTCPIILKKAENKKKHALRKTSQYSDIVKSNMNALNPIQPNIHQQLFNLTINIINFIIDILSNLTKAQESLDENPEFFLSLINHRFGNKVCESIKLNLFQSMDNDDHDSTPEDFENYNQSTNAQDD